MSDLADNETSNTSKCSSPEHRSDSRGSSVSAGLREEYEDLLRYAVVAPKLNGRAPHHVMSAPRPASPLSLQNPVTSEEEEEEEEEKQSTSSDQHHLPTPPHPASPPTHPSSQPLISHSPPPPPPPHPHTSHPHYPSMAHSHRPSDNIIQRSHDHSDDIIGIESDPELARLGTQLDSWCLQLKRNVLAEFEQARVRMLEAHQRDLQSQLQQHARAVQEAGEEVGRYKDLVVTYEASVARKDQLISSLITTLDRQRDRVQLQKCFSAWKIKNHDDQREVFTSALARRHYHHHLRTLVWRAWFSLTGGRWKARVERACQTKAKEVCSQLTTEYEERLAVSQRALDDALQEIGRLRSLHTQQEEDMKKALMRGVCALNLEAMALFRPVAGVTENGDDCQPPHAPNCEGEGEEEGEGEGASVSHHERRQVSFPMHLLPPSSSLLHPSSLVPPSSLLPPSSSLLHPSSSSAVPMHSPSSSSSSSFPSSLPPRSISPLPPTSHSNQSQPQPHSFPISVATASVQVQTSQFWDKCRVRGQSSKGAVNRKGGRGHSKPAVMIERHSTGDC